MKKFEQLLAEGYQSMAELNLMICTEHYEIECEASEKGERQFIFDDGE